MDIDHNLASHTETPNSRAFFKPLSSDCLAYYLQLRIQTEDWYFVFIYLVKDCCLQLDKKSV